MAYREDSSEIYDASEESIGYEVDEKFHPDTPVIKILQWIVTEKLNLVTNVEPYEKILKDHLIHYRYHLQLLERSQIRRLCLPLMIETFLVYFCKPSEHSVTPSPHYVISAKEPFRRPQMEKLTSKHGVIGGGKSVGVGGTGGAAVMGKPLSGSGGKGSGGSGRGGEGEGEEDEGIEGALFSPKIPLLKAQSVLGTVKMTTSSQGGGESSGIVAKGKGSGERRSRGRGSSCGGREGSGGGGESGASPTGTMRIKGQVESMMIGSSSGGDQELMAEDTCFGLSEEDRDLVVQTWQLILDMQTKGNGDKFFNLLWEEWLKTDEKARQLLGVKSQAQYYSQHLSKVINFIVKAADDPKGAVSHLMYLAVPHCVWEINSKSFNALGLAIVYALEATLGNQVMNETHKESWLTLTTEIGEKLVESYEHLRKGYHDVIYKKQTNGWKKYWTRLTVDTLYLYKTEAMKKHSEKFIFSLAKDVSVNDEFDPPYPYCFYIQFGTVKKYFCALNSASLNEWMDHSVWRIKAFSLMNTNTSVAHITMGDEKKKNSLTNVGSGIKTKNRNSQLPGNTQNSTTAPTITTPRGSKRQNLKQQSMRRHLDSQIKKQSDFSLFDNLVHSTIVIDSNGIVQYVNPTVIDLTGYSPSQLIGQNVRKLMTGNDAKLHDEYIKKYLMTGESHIIGNGRSVTLRTRDGEEISCFLTVTEHRDTGRVLFIGTITDIGGDVDPISIANEPAFSVFDSLIQATIVINNDGIIEYCNPIVEKFIGHRVEDLIGKNVSVIMDSEVAPKHTGYIKNYLETGVTHVIGVGRNIKFLHKSEKLVNAYLQVTRHDAGKKIYFIGSLTPTEETSLESFVDSHAKVLCLLEIPIIIIGVNGIILRINKGVQDAFGYVPEELQGSNVNVLMTKTHAMKHNQYIQNYINTGKAKIIGSGRVVNVVTKSGNPRQCNLTITERVQNSHRIFIGILSVLF